MLKQLEQLEEQIAYLLSSGLRHNQTVGWNVDEWREAGFPQLADHIQKVAETEGTERLTHLFLLQRQLDWLRPQLTPLGKLEDKGKKATIKGKQAAITLCPIAPICWEGQSYYLSHIQGDDHALVLVEAGQLGDGSGEYEVKNLHFTRRVILHPEYSLPLFSGEFTPVPEGEFSIHRRFEVDKSNYGIPLVSNRYFRFLHADIDEVERWRGTGHGGVFILEPYRQKVEDLLQQSGIRCYGCLILIAPYRYPCHFLPLFTTEIGKTPEESKVEHLYGV